MDQTKIQLGPSQCEPSQRIEMPSIRAVLRDGHVDVRNRTPHLLDEIVGQAHEQAQVVRLDEVRVAHISVAELKAALDARVHGRQKPRPALQDPGPHRLE